MVKRILLAMAAIAIIIVCVVAIVGSVFGNKGVLGVVDIFQYANSGNYAAGSGSVEASKVSGIEIDWVAGKVDVTEGDVRSISFTESSKKSIDGNTSMYWVLDGRVLKIKFCKSGFSLGKSVPAKNLSIVIPAGMVMGNISVDFVSSDVTVDADALRYSFNGTSGNLVVKGDVVSDVTVDAVSSKINLAFTRCPASVSVNGVSANVDMRIPADSGFTARMDSVSGKIDCSIPTISKDKKLVAGDGKADFSFSTVSGKVSIDKI